MDNKKNDFLATLVKNPDLTLTDLKTAGITPDNTALLSKEEYKGITGVQEAFKGDDGKFDEKKFNTFYDNARILYSNYANDEFLDGQYAAFGHVTKGLEVLDKIACVRTDRNDARLTKVIINSIKAVDEEDVEFEKLPQR